MSRKHIPIQDGFITQSKDELILNHKDFELVIKYRSELSNTLDTIKYPSGRRNQIKEQKVTNEIKNVTKWLKHSTNDYWKLMMQSEEGQNFILTLM